MDVPVSDDSEVANHSPSEMSDAPVPDDSGVANYSPSEMSDLTGDFNRMTGTLSPVN